MNTFSSEAILSNLFVFHLKRVYPKSEEFVPLGAHSPFLETSQFQVGQESTPEIAKMAAYLHDVSIHLNCRTVYICLYNK